ncbi:MAG: Uncharacterised protein [Hyphomonas sp. TMED17]|nr:MAG: Uncharacterised protein [Hyphomonas sp. TMED17]
MLSEKDIFSQIAPLPEYSASTIAELRPLMAENRPFIVRGLVKDWPLVQQGQKSGRDARAYLQSKARANKFVASVGPPESKGRLFYRDDMSMNFRIGKADLPKIFSEIDQIEFLEDQPLIYLSSVNMKLYFDGLCEENNLDFGDEDLLESIWIGTRTRVAAHNDFPSNIACVAVGQRRFTLFPPDQFRNLYIGPVDNTPAGRAVSMVDFHAPDYERFPKFKAALDHAMTATLDAGDAIYIPSMWWHHVEGLSPFNVLVNYWWRETPRYLGSPQNALNHAMLAIRDLPEHERKHWRDMFDYYIFEGGNAVTEVIPEHGRGVLGPLSAEAAGRLRSFLIKTLNDE